MGKFSNNNLYFRIYIQGNGNSVQPVQDATDPGDALNKRAEFKNDIKDSHTNIEKELIHLQDIVENTMY